MLVTVCQENMDDRSHVRFLRALGQCVCTGLAIRCWADVREDSGGSALCAPRSECAGVVANVLPALQTAQLFGLRVCVIWKRQAQGGK